MQTEEGREYAESHGMKFLETSAKESLNIDKAFYTIGAEIKSKLVKHEDSKENDNKGNQNK